MPALSNMYEGEAFVLADEAGDITSANIHGFFYKGARFLSRHELKIDNKTPFLVTSRNVGNNSAAYFLTNEANGLNPTALGIVVHRTVGRGIHEDILLENHLNEKLELDLTVGLAADFADMYAVKRNKWEASYRPTPTRRIKWVYTSGDRHMTFLWTGGSEAERKATVVEFSQPFDVVPHAALFALSLPAKGEWRTCMDVRPEAAAFRQGEQTGVPHKDPLHKREDVPMAPQEEPSLFPPFHINAWTPVAYNLFHLYDRSAKDLTFLIQLAEAASGESHVLAAGVPWFVYYFGRDTLLTCYEVLPYRPALAFANLRRLARYQGTKVDPSRDEEPGKMPHQMPLGGTDLWSGAFNWPYYGTIDATLHWLILLSETWRWTGDRAICDELKENALRAIEWMNRYASGTGTGYIQYAKTSEKGLVSQGWKDSEDSMVCSDGSLGEPPLALCEVQGYAYDAKLRMAELAEEVWHDQKLAQQLEGEARELRDRFNRDFWIPRRGGMYALAIDGTGRRVDGLASNMGHLLWSGIVPKERVDQVVRLLMSEPMFSGWGIRTLAADEVGYNPLAYHRGTVWPFDNALIIAGLARYNKGKEVLAVAQGLGGAGVGFGYRLPEVFAGYPRELDGSPVEYPTSCSPQAWSAGAIFLILRSLMNLRPNPRETKLEAGPLLAANQLPFDMKGLEVFGRRVELAGRGGDIEVRVP